MSKYRVTIFRHDNDHRWLAGQVFPKRRCWNWTPASAR